MRVGVWSFFKRAFLFYSLIHIGVYALYHVFFNVQFNNDSLALVFGYAHTYLIKIWQMLCPALSCMLMLIACYRMGLREALLGGALLHCASLLHSLPYFYIELIKYGFDSVESITYSVLMSLGYFLFLFGFSCLGLFLGRLTFKSVKQGESALGLLKSKEYFDTALPSVRCALIFASFGAVIPLTLEIISTVSAIVNYGSTLLAKEILLMVFNYVYIIAAWGFTHASVIYMKNKIILEDTENDNNV